METQENFDGYLVFISDDEYFVVPVEDVEGPHTDEHPICDDPTCPCKEQLL